MPSPRDNHPPAERRTVEVALYRARADDEPTFALVAGIVYRREEDQEQSRLWLRLHDLQADLAAQVSDDTFRLVFAIGEVEEELFDHERDGIEKQLLQDLPSHRAIVEHAFRPEEHDLRVDEYARHRSCTLPAS